MRNRAQAFRFWAPMCYHWATETLWWAKPNMMFIHNMHPYILLWSVMLIYKHCSVESEGLRFDSSWGLRIFSLSHAWDKMKKWKMLTCFCLTWEVPNSSIRTIIIRSCKMIPYGGVGVYPWVETSYCNSWIIYSQSWSLGMSSPLKQITLNNRVRIPHSSCSALAPMLWWHLQFHPGLLFSIPECCTTRGL